MKCKFIFLALAAVMLVLFGCNNNHTTNEEHREDNIELLSDSLKEHIRKQNSLSQELVLKVDTLTQELNAAKDDIAKLQAAESKKTIDFWNGLSLLLGIFAFIAAIMAIWATRNHVKLKDLDSKFNEYLRNRGLSEQEVQHLKECKNSLANSRSQQKPDSSCVDNDNIASHERRIAELERKISHFQQLQKPVSQFTPAIPKNMQPSATRRLYAKATSNSFFTETADTKEETCAFVIEYSGEKGDFDVASFAQIKQMNDLESFLHAEGDCTMEEATNYKTNCRGECVKNDGGFWKVVKALEIKIWK